MPKVPQGSGRWLQLIAGLEAGAVVEEVVRERLFPWAETALIQVPGTRVDYNHSPGDPGSWSVKMTLFFPKTAQSDVPIWKAALEKALAEWRSEGKIGPFHCLHLDIDSLAEYYGGQVGLETYEFAQQGCSRATLELFAAEGTIRDGKERVLRMAELALRLYSSTCGDMPAEKAGQPLRTWADILARQTFGDKVQDFFAAARPALGKFTDGLAKNLTVSSSPERARWSEILEELMKELNEEPLGLRGNMPAILKVTQRHAWVGQRLLHSCFYRFYCDVPVEWMVCNSLADLLESGRIPWA